MTALPTTRTGWPGSGCNLKSLLGYWHGERNNHTYIYRVAGHSLTLDHCTEEYNGKCDLVVLKNRSKNLDQH